MAATLWALFWYDSNFALKEGSMDLSPIQGMVHTAFAGLKRSSSALIIKISGGASIPKRTCLPWT
jgi:hypothetical protein